jgi:hypothetical protein
MKQTEQHSALARLVIITLLLSGVTWAMGQTPGEQAGPRGVLRLRVRVKLASATKGLSRKRFFLLPGSLADNRAVLQKIEARPVVSRDCFYRSLGASENLIHWLDENDCESLYCREVAAADLEGPKAVPEFVQAVAAGEKELHNRDLARKWLPVYLPAPLRDSFYRRQQSDLQMLLKEAAPRAAGAVHSIMTDRNGTAYFTGLEPGTYVLSNILPIEVEQNSVLWTCEIKVKRGDLATERPFQISNRQDRNVKCVGVEKPLPVCEPKAN